MVLSRALANPRLLHSLFVAGLVAAIWASYWPSLDHVPRADQWAYLVDTRNCRTLGELWLESYSYNRIRTVGPGDTDLFRPILFGLLCLEKHCFGNSFVPSQALSLVLHTAVVLLLLTLLRRMARITPNAASAAAGPAGFAWQSFLPYAAAVFFGLNFASMELVVWAHLHGYLLFLVFVLGALLLLWQHAYRPPRSPWRAAAVLAGCWLLALVSAFTYELGQFFAVILGMAAAGVAWQRSARTAALVIGLSFAAVPLLYQAVNHWDKSAHQGRYPEEDLQDQIAQHALSLDTLEHSGRFLAFTVVQPFFPSVTGWWYQGERIHIQEPVFGWIKYVRPNLKLALSYGIAALVFGFCAAGVWRCRRDTLRRLWPMLVVPAALFGLYAAITVLGRMNMRPSRYVLCSNSYYTYIALLFFLIAAFALWQALPVRRWHRLGITLGAGLIFLGLYSSGRIHHSANRLRERSAHFHATIRQLDAFAADHRHEPDFRLAFDMRPDDPFPVTHSMPFPLILYTRWIDNHEPAYVVAFPDGDVAIEPAAAYRQRHPQRRQLFPDLVHVGSDYNVYRWEGKYYGSLHWDDVFRPDLKDHAYVIEGDSLQEVLDQVSVYYEEFMEDLRTGWCIPPRMEIKMIEAAYRGFELIEAGAYFYAAPSAEGPFSGSRFNARRYSTALVADDLDQLRRYVDEHVAVTATAAGRE